MPKYSKAVQEVLDQIRVSKMRRLLENLGKDPDKIEDTDPIAQAPLKADDWQEFRRKFVETYRDEKIQPTGMTHSEYMEYIKTSGWREGDEFEGDWYDIRYRLKQSKREQSGRNFRRQMNRAREDLDRVTKRKKVKKQQIKDFQTKLKKQAKKDYKDIMVESKAKNLASIALYDYAQQIA